MNKNHLWKYTIIFMSMSYLILLALRNNVIGEAYKAEANFFGIGFLFIAGFTAILGLIESIKKYRRNNN